MRTIGLIGALFLVFALVGCGGGGGATPPSVNASAPSAPESLMAMPLSSQVLLIWSYPTSDGGSTITDYCVYRGTVTGTLSELGRTGNGSTVYRDFTAENGTSYFYAVSAVNVAAESLQTNEVTATPMGAPSVVQSLVGIWYRQVCQFELDSAFL